jgi:hypothetical protein
LVSGSTKTARSQSSPTTPNSSRCIACNRITIHQVRSNSRRNGPTAIPPADHAPSATKGLTMHRQSKRSFRHSKEPPFRLRSNQSPLKDPRNLFSRVFQFYILFFQYNSNHKNNHLDNLKSTSLNSNFLVPLNLFKFISQTTSTLSPYFISSTLLPMRKPIESKPFIISACFKNNFK